ncbi:MAG: glutamine amidotransferase family protein [Armatimonadetes bacterium]|nr:glutamine amidotransferase family protein [Armatimonadota bacterium]
MSELTFDRGLRTISGCGLSGMMSLTGERVGGTAIRESIAILHERGNGLGGGFACYGIYPERKEHFALHIMFDNQTAQEGAEALIEQSFDVDLDERIPTRPHKNIVNPPLLMRYFVLPRAAQLDESGLAPEDFVLERVMQINAEIPGAFVFSSGKNMGAFKAVGYAEDIAEFFRLDEYQAYIWIAHGRFPTNTPGWWAGAHPFTLLDWAVVHNGEISSYGINKRYLEMFGYKCTMRTDTEVMAYLLDLLIRRHNLPVEVACDVMAAPFWEQIERMPEARRELYTALRKVYAGALVNGPFAIIFGREGEMVGINDRIKLRPLVAARKDNWLYLSSEEAGIRAMCAEPDLIWTPRAGYPVIGRLGSDIVIGEPDTADRVGVAETVGQEVTHE